MHRCDASRAMPHFCRPSVVSTPLVHKCQIVSVPEWAYRLLRSGPGCCTGADGDSVMTLAMCRCCRGRFHGCDRRRGTEGRGALGEGDSAGARAAVAGPRWCGPGGPDRTPKGPEDILLLLAFVPAVLGSQRRSQLPAGVFAEERRQPLFEEAVAVLEVEVLRRVRRLRSKVQVQSDTAWRHAALLRILLQPAVPAAAAATLTAAGCR
mmetsp:Transcript_127268/g.407334  ORF Transcript_127268/g.407334 Transcript_127268/m.407334 type:complete len:208 (+) Transcript_127268:240-863(+)